MIGASLLLSLSAASIGAFSAPDDWPQNDGNPQHSGNNTLEAGVAPATVSGLALLFQATLPGSG